MSKKLILFDLDGVLLDSKENMNLSWMAVCEKYNLNVDFMDYFSHIGRPFQNILEILNIKEKQDEIERTFNNVSSQLIDKVNIYDGVEVLLHQLMNKDIKTGIITSKETNKTQKMLALFDFTFDIVQTPNADLNGKPAPDHILYAIKQLNINASDVIYIGDMTVDYESAKRAGVDFAFASWGYGTCNDKNTIKLNNISSLMGII